MPVKLLILLSVVTIVMLFTAIPSPAITHPSEISAFAYGQQQTNAVVQWLKKTASPLNGVDATLPNNDLLHLVPLFSDVRVVGVGEATHGTSNFFRFKHRLFRFLVENCGFTVLALEADWFNCKLIDDYIRTGIGDPEALLCESYYPHWRRQEILDVIKWMRAYNNHLPSNRYESQRLKFVGMEHPCSPMVQKQLEVEVQPLGSAFVQRAKELTQDHLNWLKNRSASNRLEARKDLLKKIDNMQNFLLASKPSVSQQSKIVAAIWYLHIFKNSVFLSDSFAFDHNTVHPSNVRDRAMAETITEVLSKNGPTTKVMVWASNGHVHPQTRNGWVSVGTHLKKTFGTKYYAIAQCFLEGSFLALDEDKQADNDKPRNIFDWTEFHVGPPEIQTIELLFAKAFTVPFFVDYRATTKSRQIQKWLQQRQPIRQCATGFSKTRVGHFAGFFTAGDFDGMVFIPKTSAAHPLANAGKLPR